MLTAVLLLSSTATPYAMQFAENAVRSLVRLNPTKKFLLIYDSLQSNDLSALPNVACFRLTLNHQSFLFKWRLKNKIASLLAQKGATKFLTTIPFPALSLPQYYLKAGSTGKKNPGRLQQMQGIIVTSEREKAD